jgi:hypothetical protein
MGTSIRIDSEVFDFIEKQIKRQQKNLKSFFPVLIILVIAVILRNNGHVPPWYIDIIFIPFYFYPYLYMPLAQGLLLRKIFYKVEIVNEKVELTTFGALWKGEQIVTLDINDIKIDRTPLPKLLARIYALNTVYIDDKKYYIFNSLLLASGL